MGMARMCYVSVQYMDTNDNKSWLCNKYLMKQRRNKNASLLLNQSRTIDMTRCKRRSTDIRPEIYTS